MGPFSIALLVALAASLLAAKWLARGPWRTVAPFVLAALCAGTGLVALFRGQIGVGIGLIVLALLVWQNARRTRAGAAAKTDNPGLMTRARALEIMGLEVSANRDEIHAAYKRLMQKVHPDRGGSDYLAAQLNAARDCLLDESK